MFAMDDFGRPRRRASSLGPGLPGTLGQEVEDRACTSHCRREGLTLDGLVDGMDGVCHAFAPDDLDSILNRVRYLDFAVVVGILASIPPAVQYAGHGAADVKRRASRSVAVPLGRGSDHPDSRPDGM